MHADFPGYLRATGHQFAEATITHRGDSQHFEGFLKGQILTHYERQLSNDEFARDRWFDKPGKWEVLTLPRRSPNVKVVVMNHVVAL